MQLPLIPSNTMQYHAIPSNTIQCHVKPCNTTQYNQISYNTMLYHRIPSNTMQYHLISSNTIQYLPIPSQSSVHPTVLHPSKMAFFKLKNRYPGSVVPLAMFIVAGGNQHEESWCGRDHLLLHPQAAQPNQDELDRVNNAFSDCDTPPTLIISGFISSTKQTYWGLS